MRLKISVFSINSPDFFPPHYPDRSIKAVQLSRFLYGDVRSDDLAFKMGTVDAARKKYGGGRLRNKTEGF